MGWIPGRASTTPAAFYPSDACPLSDKISIVEEPLNDNLVGTYKVLFDSEGTECINKTIIENTDFIVDEKVNEDDVSKLFKYTSFSYTLKYDYDNYLYEDKLTFSHSTKHGGKRAITNYVPIAHNDEYTLLSIRTHLFAFAASSFTCKIPEISSSTM